MLKRRGSAGGFYESHRQITVTNENVLQWAGVERELLKTMSKRQMSFLGHFYRKGNLKRAPLKQEGSGKTKAHISLKPVELILVESNQNVRLRQKTGKREIVSK